MLHLYYLNQASQQTYYTGTTSILVSKTWFDLFMSTKSRRVRTGFKHSWFQGLKPCHGDVVCQPFSSLSSFLVPLLSYYGSGFFYVGFPLRWVLSLEWPQTRLFQMIPVERGLLLLNTSYKPPGTELHACGLSLNGSLWRWPLIGQTWVTRQALYPLQGVGPSDPKGKQRWCF